MSWIKRCVLNERCILSLIIANALLVFIQEFGIRNIFLDDIEPVFTLIFIVEMIVKINQHGFKKYFSTGWNKFDFIIIVVSIPSLAVILNNDTTAVQLNIFLTLRVFRVFKFFRLIRFFPNVSSFVTSIQRALRASYIVIAGFFLSVFIVSLVTCSLYKTIAPEYFGNPLSSFYSIFRLFSIEGWYEIPDLIASRSGETIGFLTKFYFIILLLCGGIIGLSLVNSIFVDAMVSDNNDDLQKEVNQLAKKIEDLTENINQLNKTISKN